MGSAHGSELSTWTATEIVSAVASGQVSSSEVTAAVLDAVARLDPHINAFVTVDHEGALARAAELDVLTARGESAGPLHGVPVSIKDLTPTRGLRTTMGSKFFEDWVPETDDIVASRLRAAGAVLFGKTNTPHRGHTFYTDNLVSGRTNNPWAPDRVPGGSSGGAAAAVAAGMGPLAHGTDGAGSIRLPAALCGVVGFKPSFGRIPYGSTAQVFGTVRSHAGPLARTVADAELFLRVTEGADSRDPLSFSSGRKSGRSFSRRPVRVGLSPDLGYAAVDPEVRTVVESAASAFEEAGMAVSVVELGWPDPTEMQTVLWNASMAMFGAQLMAKPEWAEPSLWEMVKAGSGVSMADYGQAISYRADYYHIVRQAFSDIDLLITPTSSVPAWPHDAMPVTVGGRPTPTHMHVVPFCFPFNWCGLPAISLPAGLTGQGLPVGLQLVGPWRSDDLVLRAAALFERARYWPYRPPPADAAHRHSR
jgi:aspartyl-tRNA(Asn)/glutamyl-tRNA(Gln) amidotransferase subunit A